TADERRQVLLRNVFPRQTPADMNFHFTSEAVRNACKHGETLATAKDAVPADDPGGAYRELIGSHQVGFACLADLVTCDLVFQQVPGAAIILNGNEIAAHEFGRGDDKEVNGFQKLPLGRSHRAAYGTHHHEYALHVEHLVGHLTLRAGQKLRKD